MITDLTSSAVTLAASTISAEQTKACVVTVGGISALTGPSRNANLVPWPYDSWNLEHSTATVLVKTGGNAWNFVADHACGKALVADATKFVEQSGAKAFRPIDQGGCRTVKA